MEVSVCLSDGDIHIIVMDTHIMDGDIILITAGDGDTHITAGAGHIMATVTAAAATGTTTPHHIIITATIITHITMVPETIGVQTQMVLAAHTSVIQEVLAKCMKMHWL